MKKDFTGWHTLKERLTLAEIEFCQLGDSPDSETWNRHYTRLIDEYQTALHCQDEGWASDTLCEIRKCLGGMKDAAMTCDLGEIAEWLGKALDRGSYSH